MQGFMPYQQKQPIMVHHTPSFWEQLVPTLATTLVGSLVGGPIGGMLGGMLSAGANAGGLTAGAQSLYPQASNWLMGGSQATTNPFQMAFLGG